MKLMVTQKDLNAIGNLIDLKLDQKLDPIIEKIEHLPTKNELIPLRKYTRTEDI